jgi:hypothetical protein
MVSTWEKTMTRSVETADGHSRSFAYGINMAAALFPAGAAVILAEQ